MPGMLWSIGPEPGWVRASTGRIQSSREDGGPVSAPRSCVPDLTDPATLGCLLALVREAWGDPEAHLALGGGGWVLMSGESRVADVVYPSPAGRTEAAALVAALEAAP